MTMIVQPPMTRFSSLKWTTRVIGFVWAILTGCFAIINFFIFVQPQWIGDSLLSPRAGYFGLYSYCVSEANDYEFDCQGTWMNFRSILNIPFILTTFLVGFSLLLIFACLLMFLLFFCLRTRVVYFICACLQAMCALCLLIAVIVYPTGWDDETIRAVCGAQVSNYYPDTCQIRWAYILAVIGFFNVATLALLALFLGRKQYESGMMTEVINPIHMISKYGQLNETFDDRTITESNRSTARLR